MMHDIFDPQNMVIHPGDQCPRTGSGQHRGHWEPQANRELSSTTLRSVARFACRLCGFEQIVQIDSTYPGGVPGPVQEWWR